MSLNVTYIAKQLQCVKVEFGHTDLIRAVIDTVERHVDLALDAGERGRWEVEFLADKAGNTTAVAQYVVERKERAS